MTLASDAAMRLQIAQHLLLVFEDIDWRRSRLTLDELQIYPDQQSIDAVCEWVTQTIRTQETLAVK